jgi:glycerol-1-phosphate dehydrogenase [NAD(P)+]
VTVFDIVSSALEKTAQIGPRLKDRANEDIKLLFESLVIVGIAMSYVANSRPASGSEHHLSHFFEVVGLLNNEPYLPHGICVACSSVLTQRLREAIIEKEEFKQASEFVRENWEREIRRIYGKAADGIIELQNKTKLYEKDFAAVYKEKWKDIIDTLKKTPKADYILGLLDASDISFDEFKAVYSPEKISDAIWFAKDLKDRYTVLWLYYLLKYKGE